MDLQSSGMSENTEIKQAEDGTWAVFGPDGIAGVVQRVDGGYTVRPTGWNKYIGNFASVQAAQDALERKAYLDPYDETRPPNA